VLRDIRSGCMGDSPARRNVTTKQSKSILVSSNSVNGEPPQFNSSKDVAAGSSFRCSVISSILHSCGDRCWAKRTSAPAARGVHSKMLHTK
jgi:hypothetical protein